MKTLILLRHAKSGWEDGDASDFDRRLNGRGRSAALLVGRNVRAQGPEFDAVIVSPAARALETWEGFVEGYGPAPEPTLDADVYLASAETLLGIVRATDDRIERLLVIGHNPGFQQLALLLTAGDGEARQRLTGNYPTAALIEIDLPVDHWSDAAEGSGTIRRFVTPRELGDEQG